MDEEDDSITNLRSNLMSRPLSKTQSLFRKARRYIPNGVNSNFRYWGDDDTLVITRGAGPHIWDADGNRYIDYRLGFGPIILGHAHPAVTERVCKAVQDGTLFAATTPLEIELAERFVRLTGMDKVRLANTGSEATSHTLRIARAYTGRERFIKFDGQYHGAYDYVLYNTPAVSADRMGPRRRTRHVATSKGIPRAIQNYIVTLPYNDFECLEEAFEAHGEELAAVMVEPMMGNTAGILPKPGWLEQMRALCDRYGVLLVFDEVKTGFRLANGGAQEYFGVRADLAAYAKAMGNGYPVAAVAGSERIMAMIDEGDVAHGGTYVGNTVATAAANATLEMLEREPVIETIFATGSALMAGLGEILTRHGITHVVAGVPSMFGLMVGCEQPPADYHGYARADHEFYAHVVSGLIERGVLPDDDSREPWFLCYSHDSADVAYTLEAFEQALREAKQSYVSPVKPLPLAA